MQREGRVLEHSMSESGDIEYYDIQWADGVVEEGIPAEALMLTEGHKHNNHPARKGKKKSSKK